MIIKEHTQAYLEQCKYRLKKRKRSRYIDHLKIIDYGSENDSDSDSIDYVKTKNHDNENVELFR